MSSDTTWDDSDRRGFRVHGGPLGAEQVERSLARGSDLARPVRELVTTCCGGAVQSGHELPRRPRRPSGVDLIAALASFLVTEPHVEATLTDGEDSERMPEFLALTALCMGMSAALESLPVAGAMLKERSGFE
jgi:4-carboxymuconolactone decarboxylase